MAILVFGMSSMGAYQSKSNFEVMNIEIENSLSESVDELEEYEAFERGYDLPIDEAAKEAAESDCKEKLLMLKEIYIAADKGTALNAVIGEETAGQMLSVLQETGCPISADSFHYNMAHYEKMEQFLSDSLRGEGGEIVIYDIHSSGGIGRKQFIFDGADMYVLGTTAIWNSENQPCISDTSYTRLKKWEYTDKGYFSFSYCVPEPPYVSEAINGNTLIRVKPQEEKNIEIAKKYLCPIGYQGNNLLCSNWDAAHLTDLDYNGLFEYLYSIKFGEKPERDKYGNGIPKDEFEDLIMSYLPVTAKQVRQYAVYDEEEQKYVWNSLGCLNYAPNEFGTSYPEVTEIQEKEDGIVILTVDAVCEMMGNDAVMTHLLTVKFSENGQIQYLSNRIPEEELKKIPAYQYRIR